MAQGGASIRMAQGGINKDGRGEYGSRGASIRMDGGVWLKGVSMRMDGGVEVQTDITNETLDVCACGEGQ